MIKTALAGKINFEIFFQRGNHRKKFKELKKFRRIKTFPFFNSSKNYSFDGKEEAEGAKECSNN